MSLFKIVGLIEVSLKFMKEKKVDILPISCFPVRIKNDQPNAVFSSIRINYVR